MSPKKKKPLRKTVKKKAPKKKAPVKKKPSMKKAASVKISAAATKTPKEKGIVVGKITHYFPHVNAGVIKLKAPLSVGDTIKIKGHTTDLTETITSMQIDRAAVNSAKKGEEIGILVNSRVRQHDVVYKI